MNLFFTDMVIGFTQRIRTVSESDAPEGEDIFTIEIPVATLRIAEKEHPMLFLLQESSSTAIVGPRGDLENNPLQDAAFGNRTEHGSPIQEVFDLQPLQATIPPLTVDIRDDLRPEDEECFTIFLFNYVYRLHWYCNEDDSGEDNYLCQTTVCIMDDDGVLKKSFLMTCAIIIHSLKPNRSRQHRRRAYHLL